MNTMSLLEKFTAWLAASMLVIGAWLLFTSMASGAGQANTILRSRVSSDPSLTGTSLATAPRLASSERVPADSFDQGAAAAAPYREKRFLAALEQVESGGDARAIGDGGRARGSFQFWAVAWHETSQARARAGRPVFHYATGATNRAIALDYARSYLGMLHASLTRALRRTPTHAELYAAWNMGFTAFRRTGFSLSRCPASTRRAAGRLTELLAGHINGGAASKGAMLAALPAQGTRSR